MYHERMLGYYPKAIQEIEEFQAIIDSEYLEVTELKNNIDEVLADAYLTTMSEERIAEWEKLLSIRPLEESTLEDRRETIIARIRGQGKLNTNLIKTIVRTFTDSECETWMEENVLTVHVSPSKNGKKYLLDNVIQELSLKLPAHLRLSVSRTNESWADVKKKHTNWNSILDNYSTWEDVYYGFRTKAN